MLNVDLAGCTSLSLNDSAKIRQFPDTTKFQRVIRRDFQHAFNLKPVKQSNSAVLRPATHTFFRRETLEFKRRNTCTLFSIQLFSFF